MPRQNHKGRLAGVIITAALSIPLLGIAVSLTAVVNAQAPKLQSTHDVAEESPGSYRITGDDPYFVLPVNGVRADADASLSLAISIEDPQTVERSVPMELFFNASDGGSGAVFDPAFRFKFRIPAGQNQTFELPLSPDISLSDGQLARIDIDGCGGCLIKLNSGLRLSRVTAGAADGETLLVNDSRLYNGFKSVPPAGLEVNLSEWTLHDLKIVKSATVQKALLLSQTGNDPFLVSPLLDIRTDTFGGVLIELDAPPTAKPIYDFQVFYATEAHAFVERASSILRVAGSKAASSEINKLRFLVPLDFLSTQSPPDQLLQRLRLDLPPTVAINRQADAAQNWLLRSIKIINPQQLSEYQNLIPHQLIHSKRQRASHGQTLRGILAKISGDLGFTLGYALLLLLVVIISIRKYRKTLNLD